MCERARCAECDVQAPPQGMGKPKAFARAEYLRKGIAQL
jgi:hypothetical protein